MKKIFFRLLYFLPIPICFFCVTFFVDPANIIIRAEVYESIVQLLIKEKKNITNVPNINERFLQKMYIENFEVCPNEIILGSSRIMMIGEAANIQKINSFNNGVGRATLEDVLSIYYLYEKKGCRIKKISIGLEPYYLNNNNNLKGCETLNSEFVEFCNKLFPDKKAQCDFIFDDKYKELFSCSYFRWSLKYIFKDKQVYPTENINNVEVTRLTDGSSTYEETRRNLSSSEVDNIVNQSIADHRSTYHFMQDWPELSVYYKTLFSSFVEYAIKNNIELEFVFVPIHPILFSYLQNDPNYRMFFEAEEFYREIATEKHIKIIGSFNPSGYNLDSGDFYDALHCREEVIKKIYANN